MTAPDEALTLCRRACNLSPSDSWVLGAFGTISIFSGDLGEALAVLGRAAKLAEVLYARIPQVHLRFGRHDNSRKVQRFDFLIVLKSEPTAFSAIAGLLVATEG